MLNISITSPLWRDKEEVREGKSQGFRQIGCLVAYGDDIWERNLLGWLGFFCEPIKNQHIHRFGGSLNALNARWEMKTDTACEVSSFCIIVPGGRRINGLWRVTHSNTWIWLQFSIKHDLACCCISAATPSGCLAVMVTMPSDVTFPNFSLCGSHGWSALRWPEALHQKNGSRQHLGGWKFWKKTHSPFF